MIRKPRDLPTTVSDSTGRPFVGDHGLPGFIQTLFTSRHGPCGMTFVQEGSAPLDHLFVDLLDDLCAERVVAPVRKCEPSAEGDLILIHDFSDSIVQRKR